MIIIGGLFVLAALLSVLMIFVMPAERLTIIQKVLRIILPQPRSIVHTDTHEDLKSDFIDRGHVASYNWADNPKYSHAARIVDHLESLKTSPDELDLNTPDTRVNTPIFEQPRKSSSQDSLN